jgi:allantoate deiminase
MTCSRAVAGDPVSEAGELADSEGTTLAEALAAFEPAQGDLPAKRRPEELLGFLEAHIEQGPVLETEDLPIGVVTAIAAQKRLLARIIGVAGHAGTTPMHLRCDPGPAAAEAILAVERICGAEAGLVGTVGRVSALPGAFNVIPGAVEFSLDVRAPTSAVRDVAVERIAAELQAIVARRDLGLSLELAQDLAASPCDPHLTAMLEAAVADVGVAPRRLPSGAGHDAMVIAGLCPSAMLFIRCRGGVSHNPAEAVDPKDAAIAARAMLAFIERLAAEREPRGAKR